MKPARHKIHVKRGDVVEVLSGEDAGKTGKVLRVFPATGRVLVEGINYCKRHMRKSQDNPQGKIVEKEAPLAASKLKVHSPAEAKKKDAPA